MVKRPQQRYDTLFRELRNQVAEQSSNANNAGAINNNASASASASADDMKNELKRYLMDLNSSQPTHTNQDPQPQSDFIEMGSIYK